MKHILLVFLVLGFGAMSALFAQTNPSPAEWGDMSSLPTGPSLSLAIEVLDQEDPVMGTTDWIAAVDADDANVILDFERIGPNNDGRYVSFLDVPAPPGASNSLHLVLWDASEDLFHIVVDATGEPLVILWAPGGAGGVFIDGYELFDENNNIFPGQESAEMPGNEDFAAIVAQLPVELTLFAGNYTGKTVNLNWSTASEDGNDYFAVERSSDGVDFQEIGRVTGANEAASYEYADTAPLAGTNYYRLKQNDFMGEYAYSPVIQITATERNKLGVTAFPNPAVNTFSLNLRGEWGERITVSLVDQVGRKVGTWNRTPASLRKLVLPNVQSGVYQVIASDGNQTTAVRLFVNR